MQRHTPSKGIAGEMLPVGFTAARWIDFCILRRDHDAKAVL
jgi:hypothetical protein